MSFQLFLVDKLIRWQIKRRFTQRPDIMRLRKMMGSMRERPARVPGRVSLEPGSLGGIPTETLRPRGASKAAAILYIHGGAFVAGSPIEYRALTWRLADALLVAVHAVEYRLAPEHPFPAAVDDVVAAYRALRASGVERVVVMGDSAGGNLTLALALRLKELGDRMPEALVCLSPATELLGDLPSHAENAASDALFDPRLRPSVRDKYCSHDEAGSPLVSPLRGDVAGLPPTLIQCSAVEMLRDDGVHMGERLRAAGVDARVDVWPHVFHVWHMFADVLPEARRAIDDIATFARPYLDAR